MKTKTTLIKAFLILMAIALTVSCKKGEPGPAGPAGPQGIQGVAGANGNTILSGTGTPTSTTGNAGDYYLDLSTSNLYGPKTSNGWGNSVSLKGANGTTGATGSTGANGTNGTNGTNGNGILSGNGVPSAGLGVNGDFYLDKTTYNLYGPKTAGSWGVPTSLVGPAGPISYADLSFTDIKAQEAKMTTANITGTSSTNMWNNGNIIIFKTSEDRYGKFRITNIDITQNFRLSMSITVYNTDGSVKYADKAVVIDGTFSCELDQGISTTYQLGDFHWDRQTATLTLLAPLNGAKFYQYK